MVSSLHQQTSTFRYHSEETHSTIRHSTLRYRPRRPRRTRSCSITRWRCKRPWFHRRSPHRLHRHERERERVETSLLDLEDALLESEIEYAILFRGHHGLFLFITFEHGQSLLTSAETVRECCVLWMNTILYMCQTRQPRP